MRCVFSEANIDINDFGPYALGKRNENDVEYEEERCVDMLAQELPAVVFRANAVAPLTPVVERQACLALSIKLSKSRTRDTNTPQCARSKQGVQSRGW